MELLAPAGNLEKLKWAVIYGADAVYFGTQFGSLRSYAGNFSFDDAEAGLRHLHAHGKKGYVTLNIYPFSDEYPKIIHIAQTLDEMGADAIIVSDLGVFTALKKSNLKAGLHISTQANTLNYQTALAYKGLGAKRVNLARELSLSQIKEVLAHTKDRIETEVFIHGAVCFSYSGRCAISDYLANARANRGECKHPCRWKYTVMEETRPGQYMPVCEDDRGTYLFNSKELALFEYVPALTEIGVDSLKIEGRMKSIHYIATVVSFYRQVLDGKCFTLEQGLALLNRVPNRGYSAGFMKGHMDADDYQIHQSTSQFGSRYVGHITEEKIAGQHVMEVKNTIRGGETLEVLQPDGAISSIQLPDPLHTREGMQLDVVNHSHFVLLGQDLQPYTLLRRVDRAPEPNQNA
jgi:putative protease